jgi:hypothetical protein
MAEVPLYRRLDAIEAHAMHSLGVDPLPVLEHLHELELRRAYGLINWTGPVPFGIQAKTPSEGT